jgi:hypothetical protein
MEEDIELLDRAIAGHDATAVVGAMGDERSRAPKQSYYDAQ